MASTTKLKATAFFGDSFTTGFFLKNELSFDLGTAMKVLNTPPSESPDQMLGKLGPTFTESLGGFSHTLSFINEYFIALYLESPEHSWIRQISQKDETSTLLAAQSGSSSVLAQTKRVLDKIARDQVSLSSAYFFFGQDALCGLNQFSDPLEIADGISVEIDRSLKQIASLATRQESKVPVFLLGPLSMLQLLGKAFREHRVPAHEGELSCQDLVAKKSYSEEAKKLLVKDSAPELTYLLDLLPPSPLRLCPALFTEYQASNQNGVLQLSKFISSLRDSLKKLEEKWQSHEFVEVSYLKATEVFHLDPKYLAKDCYHLSADGQKALGQAILADSER